MLYFLYQIQASAHSTPGPLTSSEHWSSTPSHCLLLKPRCAPFMDTFSHSLGHIPVTSASLVRSRAAKTHGLCFCYFLCVFRQVTQCLCASNCLPLRHFKGRCKKQSTYVQSVSHTTGGQQMVSFILCSGVLQRRRSPVTDQQFFLHLHLQTHLCSQKPLHTSPGRQGWVATRGVPDSVAHGGPSEHSQDSALASL